MFPSEELNNRYSLWRPVIDEYIRAAINVKEKLQEFSYAYIDSEGWFRVHCYNCSPEIIQKIRRHAHREDDHDDSQHFNNLNPW